ncbi:elongation of very long chain fatty acids protein AAEL008004 [Rhipicephalus sanguineus]|uniref:Elongation of very long chain fatty acids protein n=1 Tax=Rhipicephalus sanguineus TaxID=34632 RepID=A0A9D4SUL2_RHISA|nr:elongation of very long chain fatty acids protein AAEL008004 [Rhipicephalus sanguineus]KAH7947818.1 hypothetical protein HPB52_016005 [Rhipicephalus sanguineus]
MGIPVFDQLSWAYHSVLSNTDPRVAKWPLMGSPLPVISILIGYVYFVKVWGPAWMRDRKAFNLRNIILAYNMGHVAANAFFFFYGGRLTYLFGDYSWFCEPVNLTTEPKSMLLITLGWWYMLLKLSELMDTVFFVLTKKNSHISALHVIHHSLVAWSVWLGVNFGATGQNAFFPFLNCFIHMIMYTYYALAALGPRLRPYLWWKRYLTQLQMSQFIALMIHGAIPVFYDCGFPPYFGYMTILEAVLFFVLFFNFYVKTYTRNNSLRQENGLRQEAVKSR